MPKRSRSPIEMRQLLLLAGVLLSAAFLTQCRMVTDRIVRPDAEELRGANSCVRACTRAANEAKEAENERHRDAVKACRGDEDGDDDLKGNGSFHREKPGDRRDDRDKRDRGDEGDRDDRKNACLEAEEARHKAALKAIDEQRRACLNGCHHQGGGSGR